MPRVPWALMSYRHRSLPVSAQRLINWYAEQQPRGSKSEAVLLPTPGVAPFVALPQGPVRGMHVMGPDLFVVSGRNAYRITAVGTVTDLGELDRGGAVSMADNGTQCVIVVPESAKAWIARRDVNTLAPITDPDFLPALSVDVLSGFAAFVRRDSTEFFISEVNDAAAYDALDFASAEGSPDNLVALRRVGSQLWLFGEKTTEIWTPIEGEGFPFQRVNGAFVERGCAAGFSIAVGAGTVFWLGDDRVAYVGDGFRPRRISTHAIEQALAGYARVDDARAWFYEEEGHQFYVLSFPSDGATWVYDLATGLWHERESETYSTWRCITGVAYAGGVIAGDARIGQLWRVANTVYDENGEPIRRVATGGPLHSEARRMFFNRVEADVEQGVGVALGAPATCWMTFSDDGGRTWSNEAWASLGAIGDYRRRVKWERVGSGRERVFRFGMSDASRTALMGMTFDVEVGQT